MLNSLFNLILRFGWAGTFWIQSLALTIKELAKTIRTLYVLRLLVFGSNLNIEEPLKTLEEVRDLQPRVFNRTYS